MSHRQERLWWVALGVLASWSCGSDPEAPCPTGTARCGTTCVDLQVDPLACGACGHACVDGEVCASGVCALDCPSGQLVCDAACVDPSISLTHCGASGDCAGSSAGTTCASDEVCASGVCTLVCPLGQLVCDEACLDPASSLVHCGATDDCTGAHAGAACTATQRCLGGRCEESCEPVTLDLDTPFSVDPPPFAARRGQQTPTALWASSAPPLPTNTTWQNLVLGAGGGRFVMLPYQLRAEPVWLDVAASAPTNTPTEVSVPDRKQVMLGALQFGAGTQHTVESYDLLSVTLRYTQGAGSMTAPLVQGSPYITVDYAGGLRPMLLPGTFTFARVNGSTSPGLVRGTRFELALSDGSTWVLYASAPLAFNWTVNNLVAAAAFDGTLRVANAPDPSALAVLDAHAGAIPRGGRVEVTTACDVATLRFVYTSTGAGSLLLAAMPHHLARLVSTPTTSLSYSTLSGTLRGVEGSTWTLRLPLSTVGFTAPRPVASAHLAAVQQALAGDAAFEPDRTTVDLDPYFGGKQLAKLARLAVIADEVGDPVTAATLRARLAPLVAGWLDGTNGDPLVYDTTWGGVVATRALADPGAAFGSGHYNDHHFHYGYFLYAAAVLARSDPTFATTHRAGLLALVRDIANPSAADPHFPRFRHLDLFRGHSWAAGLSELGDGQNQESTSEAVNAWYGLQLLGLATEDARMTELGRVLLALEVDSAQTYWQIPAASDVYGAPFRENRCVGILFETKVVFATFFAAGPEYVYGIQLLPFTPASEALVSPAWVRDAWPQLERAASTAPPGWKGFLHMAHATVDAEAAWTALNALAGTGSDPSRWDDGNSRTNALWWAATRP